MTQSKSLFEKLANNEIPSWKIWENDKHMAFLTPFPNTPGVTVVAPKMNIGDDAFEISDQEYQELLAIAKKIATALKKALKVSRVALVIEGLGVPHVHIKLFPLHGDLNNNGHWQSDHRFFPEYIGYLITSNGPQMSDEELSNLQTQIKQVININ